MMTKIKLLIALTVFVLASCQNKSNKTSVEETAVSGSTQIVVDESLAPIVQDQYDVFSNSYQSATIKFIFQPENKLLNTFLSNQVNIAIMTRALLPKEAKVFESKRIKIRMNRFAVDAVTLIANRSMVDSTITVEELIATMQGKSKRLKLVFDNANSSTVRYLKELAKVDQLPATGIYALNSNSEVIKYVHNNKGALGVIGVNWIKSPGKDVEELVKDVRILKVKNLKGLPGSDAFYKPSQSNLALGLYPLSRNLYIINCQGTPGLGTGFASFLASERGQRIVLKSGLLPDSLPSREIFIK
ncbi:PstS family phosphate ABC transporter substrate-binding protein [Desertivirga arenae]|uniref:PstS family phosphate ABC transporter substrate-binding protein n=1 Tax=Desertivirga arenae TaxID=2810309 RepID=UPI001A95FD4C|nr:substrate-binding domain-containing protein [Pedobacter sp. SYSU D00823]